MSGLCGWRGFPAAEEHAYERVEAMSASLGRFDGLRPLVWCSSRAGLGVADSAGAAAMAQIGGIRAIVTGSPRFEDPRFEEIRRMRGSAAAFATAYRERGTRFFAGVLGTFAAALYDEKSSALLLATDRLAVCPMLFQVLDATIVFGSTSHALSAAGVASDVDPQALLNYLYFGTVPAPGSVFRGREALLPGEYLLCRDGRIERTAYWQAEYNDLADRPTKELKAEFLETLHDCVARAAEGAKAAAFLSGGLDSSSVAGALKRANGQASAYSIGFRAEGYDEMTFARAAAKHFGLDHHEYYVTEDDVVAAIPKIAEIYAEPFGNESAVPAYYCAKMARADGVERMLAGDGGDEIFGGNERYSTQLVFGIYEKVPGFMRRLLEPVLDHFPFGEKIYPIRRGRGYVRYARLPMPGRLQFFNFVERVGVDAIFRPSVLRDMDIERTRALYRGVYDSARANSMVNKMLELDMKFTLADNDLPKVCRMCELAQVQVAFPMLDTAMLDFAAKLHVDRKVKIGKLRPLMRAALADFLPKEVLAKSKHGFGLPFGVWLRTHEPLRELMRTSLDGLRTRGLFLDSFLDKVVASHESEDAAFYGAVIWRLMMLELWYRNHVDTAAQPVGSARS